MSTKDKKTNTLETATFGAGCFWGIEEAFLNLKGVDSTAVGYMGGTCENPTYEQVCTDLTGHAEVVHIKYDKAQVSYEELLELFWKSYDSTTKNRQGPDTGSQYRSVIFYHTPEQKKLAEKSKQKQTERYNQPIVTETSKASTFYRAEEYHQQYLAKQGRSSCRLAHTNFQDAHLNIE